MKQKSILNSVAGLFLKAFEGRKGKLEQPPRAPNPTEEQHLRQALLVIEAEGNSGPPEYRHWGLNE